MIPIDFIEKCFIPGELSVLYYDGVHSKTVTDEGGKESLCFHSAIISCGRYQVIQISNRDKQYTYIYIWFAVEGIKKILNLKSVIEKTDCRIEFR